MIAVFIVVWALAACSGPEHAPGGQTTHPVTQTGTPNTPSGDARARVDLSRVLPPDRRAVWDPGLNPVGGIPKRTRLCATVTPSGGDDTQAIQMALDSCPANQVVSLTAGTFNISGEGLALTRSEITLRGTGPATRLVKQPGSNLPVIIIGTRWYKYTQPVDLVADAAQGATAVTLRSDPGLLPGEIVTIDQVTNPTLTQWSPTRSPPGNESRGWFGRYDRPIGQVLEVKSVNGTSVTFTTPLHIGFTTASKAQVVRFSADENGPMTPAVRYSGVEDLYVYGGEGGDGGGNIHLFATAYSWVKNVESDGSSGASVSLDGTFRCVLRDSYLHSTKDPNPGGGGYGIALNQYAADNLVENNISWNFNKVIVMRTTGGGNVIGYNYMEDGWGSGYPTIPEVGLNAAHMTTPHYELFEGNQSWNFDGDSVWGNSIYITVFRNHLTGKRRSVSPLQLTDQVNRRAIGLTVGHWWYSFLGNVLGTAGQSPVPPQTSFVYETNDFTADDPVPMWKLGYDGEDGSKPQDTAVAATTIRQGNYDYVTTTVVGDPALPPSLYLTSKPAFFGSSTWPWVTPETETRLAVLPARARFDAMS